MFFVSYAREQSAFALQLALDLKSTGMSVWLDQQDIVAGSDWTKAIEQALLESKGLIVILSPDAVTSRNVLDEVTFAFDEDKSIIPVLASPCELPLRLRRLQYVDFVQDYEMGLLRLQKALELKSPRPPEQESNRTRKVYSSRFTASLVWGGIGGALTAAAAVHFPVNVVTLAELAVASIVGLIAGSITGISFRTTLITVGVVACIVPFTTLLIANYGPNPHFDVIEGALSAWVLGSPVLGALLGFFIGALRGWGSSTASGRNIRRGTHLGLRWAGIAAMALSASTLGYSQYSSLHQQPAPDKPKEIPAPAPTLSAPVPKWPEGPGVLYGIWPVMAWLEWSEVPNTEYYEVEIQLLDDKSGRWSGDRALPERKLQTPGTFAYFPIDKTQTARWRVGAVVKDAPTVFSRWCEVKWGGIQAQ